MSKADDHETNEFQNYLKIKVQTEINPDQTMHFYGTQV